MTLALQDAFADSLFWIALVVDRDQHHKRAKQWALQVSGRIITTIPVLVETANTLAKPAWRASAIPLIDHLLLRPDVDVLPLSDDLWNRSYDLYRARPDKAWSLTDCSSFIVMQDRDLTDALTADSHFTQAGYRAVLLDDP